MSLKDYPHEHPEIAELQRTVAQLTRIVDFQGRRMDRLEAELDQARFDLSTVYVAERQAVQAMQLARGAAVLATNFGAEEK
jgi:hypothetical protein